MVFQNNWYPVFFILFIGLFSSCERGVKIFPHKRVIQTGDDMSWADPNFDDSDWDKSGNTVETGMYWVRFEINFDHHVDQIKNKGIQMVSIASYEAYWDGQLIYKNGRLGENKNEEIPGAFISYIHLPDSLCRAGKHVLALRLSNFHNVFIKGSWNTFFIEEYLQTNRNNLKLTAFMFILGGAYLIASIYYFFLFINQKKEYSKFIFSILCFLFFCLIVMEFAKFYFPYPYHHHYYRLFIIGLLTMAIAFIIHWFLSIQFDFQKRKYFIPLYGFLLILIAHHENLINDSTSQLMSELMLVTSIILSVCALVLKRRGSWAVTFAFFLVAMITYLPDYNLSPLIYDYDINLFIGFTILILSMLYVMAQRAKEQQQAYEASILLSSRLKNELLKKNIKPHFIMNTLTSIMEWVEVSPKKSIEFIEALADEFDILNEIADQRLIPIGQEIDLCKRHLKIMGFRKELKYHWEDFGIMEEEKIPPAVLHTIVENGITHCIPDEEGKISFRLTYESTPKYKKYTLSTLAKNRKKKNKNAGGTGLKYIRSRLEESYHGSWDLVFEEVATGWRTVITIFK